MRAVSRALQRTCVGSTGWVQLVGQELSSALIPSSSAATQQPLRQLAVGLTTLPGEASSSAHHFSVHRALSSCTHAPHAWHSLGAHHAHPHSQRQQQQEGQAGTSNYWLDHSHVLSGQRHASTSTATSAASPSAPSEQASPSAGTAAAATAPPPKPSILDRVAGAVGPRVTAAVTLHAGSAWQRHKSKVFAAGGAVAAYGLWRVTWKAASGFVALSESVAEWGFMGLAVTAVAATGQYAAWHYGLSSSGAYRAAMLKLNSSPAVLEVLGAPLAGSDLRAYVVTGGGLYLSRKAAFRPKLRSRRMLMLFPLRGSERSGLVSLEVKKKEGRYAFKLLAVDVARDAAVLGAPHAQPARIYVQGNESIYERGAVLGALREPFLKAASLQPALDREEEEEADADAAAKAAQSAAGGSGGRGGGSGITARLQGLLGGLVPGSAGSAGATGAPKAAGAAAAPQPAAAAAPPKAAAPDTAASSNEPLKATQAEATAAAGATAAADAAAAGAGAGGDKEGGQEGGRSGLSAFLWGPKK